MTEVRHRSADTQFPKSDASEWAPKRLPCLSQVGFHTARYRQFIIVLGNTRKRFRHENCTGIERLMYKLSVAVSIFLLSACQNGSPQPDGKGATATNSPDKIAGDAIKGSLPVAISCPARKQGDWGGNIICEGGDPAVLAALPAWARPPSKVQVSNTSVDPEGHDRGIGYAAKYDGPLSDIEPLYRAQIAQDSSIKIAAQGRMLVVSKIGNTSGTYLSLTPQQTGSGGEIVQILFYQSIPQ